MRKQAVTFEQEKQLIAQVSQTTGLDRQRAELLAFQDRERELAKGQPWERRKAVGWLITEGRLR